MKMTPKNSGRFDDVYYWMLEQIGVARFVKECDEAAKSLLADAERELCGLTEEFRSVKLNSKVKSSAIRAPACYDDQAEAFGDEAKTSGRFGPTVLAGKRAHIVPEHPRVC